MPQPVLVAADANAEFLAGDALRRAHGDEISRRRVESGAAPVRPASVHGYASGHARRVGGHRIREALRRRVRLHLFRFERRNGEWKILHRSTIFDFNQNHDASAVWGEAYGDKYKGKPSQ